MSNRKPAQTDSEPMASDTHAQALAEAQEALSGDVVADQPAALEGDAPTKGAMSVYRKGGPAGDRQDLAEISPASQAAVRELNAWLDDNLTGEVDPEAAVADIIAQIMSSSSVEEVLGDTALTGLLELLDIPIRIHGGKFNRSDYEAGAPYYAIMDVERLDNGWRGLVSTGAQSVLAQIVRITQLDGWPHACKPVYATKKPTASGYRPIRLGAI